MGAGREQHRRRVELYSGADNRFLLTEDPLEDTQQAEFARAACRLLLFEGAGADGLLVLEGARGAAPQLRIYNADGSRPQACGNGLRCVGWHLARTGREQEFEVRSDAGPRRTRVVEVHGDEATLLVEMGPVQLAPLSPPWPKVAGLLEAFEGDVGNPHCVLRVEDERELDAQAIHMALQTHPAFPAGVNLGLLARRGASWHLRVFERGVGETAACGTGACAAAASLTFSPGEECIQMPGGELRVRIDRERQAQLFGQATYHGSVLLAGSQAERNSWATCSRS